MRAGLAVIAGVIVSGALVTTAHADRADQLFKKGKKLLGEKKYAEACTAFEQSDRLDPEIGAKLNVALCYREWGKLATAWRWFTEAEQMAIKAGDDRAKRIHALIAELDPSVPRLKLSLPPDAVLDGVAVRLDGAELAPGEIGEDRRVDPGPHRIETVVNGAARSKTVAVERGGTDVVLDVPVKPRPRGAPGATGKSGTTTAPDIGDPAQTRRWLGLGVSGAGVVASWCGRTTCTRSASRSRPRPISCSPPW
ncbi:MAG TPA: hypothetical protein VIX73_20735 [Kofleriaceae bacterium]|jgi:hypothetical protein